VTKYYLVQVVVIVKTFKINIHDLNENFAISFYLVLQVILSDLQTQLSQLAIQMQSSLLCLLLYCLHTKLNMHIARQHHCAKSSITVTESAVSSHKT